MGVTKKRAPRGLMALWLLLLLVHPVVPVEDLLPIALNLAIPLTSSSSSSTVIPRKTQRDNDGNEDQSFRFTSSHYNASIAENSMGKTYVTPDDKMGIHLLAPDDHRFEEIKYRIVSGDKEKFFKAEERVVGDFCFLQLRIRTGNVDVLNRERKDRYNLEIRATARRHDSKNRISLLEAQTQVSVTITDTNDLNPLFYPTFYEVNVPEDTAVHKSIVKVTAEDADLGRNGEIYYSFAEKNQQFAVHPVSGVVTLTRPLR